MPTIVSEKKMALQKIPYIWTFNLWTFKQSTGIRSGSQSLVLTLESSEIEGWREGWFSLSSQTSIAPCWQGAVRVWGEVSQSPKARCCVGLRGSGERWGEASHPFPLQISKPGMCMAARVCRENGEDPTPPLHRPQSPPNPKHWKFCSCRTPSAWGSLLLSPTSLLDLWKNWLTNELLEWTHL